MSHSAARVDSLGLYSCTACCTALERQWGRRNKRTTTAVCFFYLFAANRCSSTLKLSVKETPQEQLDHTEDWRFPDLCDPPDKQAPGLCLWGRLRGQHWVPFLNTLCPDDAYFLIEKTPKLCFKQMKWLPNCTWWMFTKLLVMLLHQLSPKSSAAPRKYGAMLRARVASQTWPNRISLLSRTYSVPTAGE